MTLRLMPSLDDQAIAYNPDLRILVIAQRWSGFIRGLHAEVHFRFTPEGCKDLQLERSGMPRTVLEQFRGAAAAMAPRAVTETRAREILVELGHPAEEHCTDVRCRARLPLGGRFCVACGKPHHVTGTGAQRTPRRAAAG
jgi:hypothetical protein